MKINLLFSIICLFTISVHAQDLDINWSRNINYDRMSTGDMDEFSGANDKYVYCLFRPTFSKIADKQRQLVVFDKLTMKQLGKLNLKSNVDFHDVCVTNDAVYVLFVDDQKGKEILYAQSFTPNLEVIAAKKKIYQIATSTKRASKSISTIKTMVNSKANSDLYIIAEKPNLKDENVVVEYTVVDKNLSNKHTGQVTLPVVSQRSTSGNLSYISVGEDGMMISKNVIRADRETRKEEKIYSYALLSVINPATGTINSLPIKSAGKHINDFEFFSKNGKLHVAGFYKDNEGKYSERGNGIFSAQLNTTTGELENSKFSEISAPKIQFGILYLEKLKYSEDGSLTLYATEDQNIVITTQTRNGTTTTYRNDKGDILIASMHKDGTLNWKNVISRKISYPTLYVRDVQVMSNEKQDYITYADMYKGGKKKNIFNRKSKKQMRDELNYTKIDKETGSMASKILPLNKAKTEKDKRRYVNAAMIREVDNVLYLDGFQQTVKTGVKIVGCLTLPLCGAGMVYFLAKMRNGSAFKGGGQIGSIHLK